MPSPVRPAASPRRPAKAPNGAWLFFREFLRSPRELGTVFQCSPAVARAMVAGLNTASWSAVAELGPGSGALTPTLLEALPEGCRFLAVERSPVLAAALHERYPQVQLVQGDAAELGAICRLSGVVRLDAVFSALPLRLLPEATQDRILAAAGAILRPGGIFGQVTYWPRAFAAGGRMRAHVERRIGPIESDRLIAGNAPPAWVFRCVKPGGDPGGNGEGPR